MMQDLHEQARWAWVRDTQKKLDRQELLIEVVIAAAFGLFFAYGMAQL